MAKDDLLSLVDEDVLQETADVAESGVRSRDTRLTPMSSVYIVPHCESVGNSIEMSMPPSEVPEKTDRNLNPRRGTGVRKMYLAAFAALLNILVGGLASSYSAPAIVDMMKPGRRIRGLTNDETTWIASFIGIGSVFGCAASPYLAQKLGRKGVMMYFSFPFMMGWLIVAYAPNISWIYAGRLLTGFCMGISVVPVPAYVIEISTVEIRGLLGTGFQLAFSVGVLLAMAFGAVLSWSWLAVVGATAIAIEPVILYFMPESPQWLVAKGRRDEAICAIRFLQGKHFDAEKECKAIEQSLASNRADLSIKDFLQPYLYKPLILSIGLMLFQQFSGMNALMGYTVSVFEETHSSLDPSVAAIVVAVVQIVMTSISGLIVDKSGRKILFVLSGVFIALGLLFLGLFEMLVMTNKISTSYGWIPVLCFIIIIGSFAVGFGPIPWIVIPEIVPLKARTAAVGIASVFNSMSMFFITKTYEMLRTSLNKYGAFWVYAAFSLLGSVLCWFFLPETKGKTLNEIQEHFKSKRSKNDVINQTQLNN